MIYTHTELQNDLAGHLGTPFVNVPCGSVWMGYWKKQRGDNGTPIADALLIRPSFTRFQISLYEVKVSRADFLSDIRTEKWKSYLPCCNRMYFAVPSGLIKKEEVPPECGIVSRGETSWRYIKGAPVREVDFTAEYLLALAFYKQKDLSNQRIKRQREILSDYANLKRRTKLYGEAVANDSITPGYKRGE